MTDPVDVAREWLDKRWPRNELGNTINETDLAALLAAQRAEAVAGPYRERNMLVGALSKLFPAWLSVDPSEPEWPVVIIQLPTGQASWHITKHERYSIFPHLDEGGAAWDGHDDIEKWRRVCTLALRAPERER